MTTSNKFTLTRLLYAPVFFILYFLPIWTGNEKLAFASVTIMIPCLIFAEITDALDGHYARKNNEVSDFGKMFDPFADVMLHLTSFMCFLLPGFKAENGAYLPLVFFLLLFFREFSMNFIRMVCAKQGIAVAARKGGKFKTVFYVVTEFYVLIIESLVRLGLSVDGCIGTLKNVAVVMFAICVVLAYTSFLDYIITFKKTIKGEK